MITDTLTCIHDPDVRTQFRTSALPVVLVVDEHVRVHNADWSPLLSEISPVVWPHGVSIDVHLRPVVHSSEGDESNGRQALVLAIAHKEVHPSCVETTSPWSSPPAPHQRTCTRAPTRDSWPAGWAGPARRAKTRRPTGARRTPWHTTPPAPGSAEWAPSLIQSAS